MDHQIIFTNKSIYDLIQTGRIRVINRNALSIGSLSILIFFFFAVSMIQFLCQMIKF